MTNEVTAYHEAGRMVAAWDLGLAVTGATIGPDEEEGYAGLVKLPVEDRVRYADWVDEHGYLYCFLVSRFAGSAASEKHTGIPMTDEEIQLMSDVGDPTSDYLVLELGGDDPDKQGEVGDRALRHAASLVSSRWNRIEAVAQELLQRKKLDEAECRQVLEDAFR